MNFKLWLENEIFDLGRMVSKLFADHSDLQLLIIADKLEESGEEEVAGFIRKRVAGANLDTPAWLGGQIPKEVTSRMSSNAIAPWNYYMPNHKNTKLYLANAQCKVGGDVYNSCYIIVGKDWKLYYIEYVNKTDTLRTLKGIEVKKRSYHILNNIEYSGTDDDIFEISVGELPYNIMFALLMIYVTRR